MSIALFDLDNTLLCGDSDHLWGKFLCDNDLVDKELYGTENDRFFAEYQAGTLDIVEYNEFCLKPLTEHKLEQLHVWRDQFIESVIAPVVLDKGSETINTHRNAGDTILIITATNQFVTSPIAAMLNVDGLIATMPETINGAYTGKLTGTPCFQEGKVTRLNEWLDQTGESLVGSHFYSDSINDLPLLKQVETPVAVDPDDKLLQHARENSWQVTSFRGDSFPHSS